MKIISGHSLRRLILKSSVSGNARLNSDNFDPDFIGYSHNDKLGFFEFMHGAKNNIENYIEGILMTADDYQVIDEFIQNAFDAGANKVIIMEYSTHECPQKAEEESTTNDQPYPHYLIVINNGEKFKIKEIEDILNIGQSQKSQDCNKIGRFGIGFKLIHRLVGAGTGIGAIMNYRGPIMFSWDNNGLRELLENFKNGKIDDMFKDIDLDNLDNEDFNYLFKFILTAFPTTPYGTDKKEGDVKDSDYKSNQQRKQQGQPALFDDREFKNFLNVVGKVIGQIIRDQYKNQENQFFNDFKQGSLFFINVPYEKRKIIEQNKENIKNGLEYSLAIISKHFNRQGLNIYLLGETIKQPKKVKIIDISERENKGNKTKKTEDRCKERTFVIYPIEKDQPIPNFYLFFPVRDEKHNWKIALHSNLFKTESNRTKLENSCYDEIDYVLDNLYNHIKNNQINEEVLDLLRAIIQSNTCQNPCDICDKFKNFVKKLVDIWPCWDQNPNQLQPYNNIKGKKPAIKDTDVKIKPPAGYVWLWDDGGKLKDDLIRWFNPPKMNIVDTLDRHAQNNINNNNINNIRRVLYVNKLTDQIQEIKEIHREIDKLWRNKKIDDDDIKRIFDRWNILIFKCGSGIQLLNNRNYLSNLVGGYILLCQNASENIYLRHLKNYFYVAEVPLSIFSALRSGSKYQYWHFIDWVNNQQNRNNWSIYLKCIILNICIKIKYPNGQYWGGYGNNFIRDLEIFKNVNGNIKPLKELMEYQQGKDWLNDWMMDPNEWKTVSQKVRNYIMTDQEIYDNVYVPNLKEFIQNYKNQINNILNDAFNLYNKIQNKKPCQGFQNEYYNRNLTPGAIKALKNLRIDVIDNDVFDWIGGNQQKEDMLGVSNMYLSNYLNNNPHNFKQIGLCFVGANNFVELFNFLARIKDLNFFTNYIFEEDKNKNTYKYKLIQKNNNKQVYINNQNINQELRNFLKQNGIYLLTNPNIGNQVQNLNIPQGEKEVVDFLKDRITIRIDYSNNTIHAIDVEGTKNTQINNQQNQAIAMLLEWILNKNNWSDEWKGKIKINGKDLTNYSKKEFKNPEWKELGLEIDKILPPSGFDTDKFSRDLERFINSNINANHIKEKFFETYKVKDEKIYEQINNINNDHQRVFVLIYELKNNKLQGGKLIRRKCANIQELKINDPQLKKDKIHNRIREILLHNLTSSNIYPPLIIKPFLILGKYFIHYPIKGKNKNKLGCIIQELYREWHEQRKEKEITMVCDTQGGCNCKLSKNKLKKYIYPDDLALDDEKIPEWLRVVENKGDFKDFLSAIGIRVGGNNDDEEVKLRSMIKEVEYELG